MPDSSSDNQPLDRSYFLRLLTAAVLLGSVWFGSKFIYPPEPISKEVPAERETISQAGGDRESLPAEEKNALAAALPVVEGVFLAPKSEKIMPIRKWDIDEPELTAQSVYALDLNSGKVLFERNADEPRPVASLSKLITALVILEKADIDEEITVSQKAVETLGDAGSLVAGETMTVKNLLYALLVESSNDAAVALAEKFNGQFIGYMNQMAQSLNLKNTRFSDPSGLSDENISTAREIAKILRETTKHPLLNSIATTAETEITSVDGILKHKLVNNNLLLSKYREIIAGKTGYIDEAGECMAVAIKSPNGGTILNVILGSKDRTGEMEKLIEWEKEAFLW